MGLKKALPKRAVQYFWYMSRGKGVRHAPTAADSEGLMTTNRVTWEQISRSASKLLMRSYANFTVNSNKDYGRVINIELHLEDSW